MDINELNAMKARALDLYNQAKYHQVTANNLANEHEQANRAALEAEQRMIADTSKAEAVPPDE